MECMKNSVPRLKKNNMSDLILDQLQKRLGDSVKADVELAPYTTFKVGGPAEYFFMASSQEDLIKAVKVAHELGLNFHIFGGVSNVVIGSEGLRGLVVKNVIMTKEVIEETDVYVILRVGSGYNMTLLAKETAESGWAGLEYHLGLPGTVGGGIAMNSGWYAHKPDKYVGDPVVKAQLIDVTGVVKEVDHDYFKFAYDYSVLRDTGEILVWADMKLLKAEAFELMEHGHQALEHRKNTQPYGIPTSGCFFQNVDGVSAGKIIDESGLKGFSIGGARVSTKHANFIENTGSATAEDVQKVVDHVKKVVKKEKGIELEEEVVCL